MENIKIFAFADEADSDFDGQIEALKRNCLDGIEIRGIDGENIADISSEKAEEVKRRLDANGLVTWSIGSPIGKIGIDDDFVAHLEKFKHTLEIASILNASNIRLFSFYLPKEINPTDCKNEVINRLGDFLRLAEGSGVNLCHENEKGIYGDIPERCLDLHQNLPQLKGVFDPANFVQCGVDTLKAWKMLKNYISYIHIKDSQNNGFVVPAGCGDGNLKEITRDYLTQGGRAFTIEPHLTVFDGLASLEKEGDKSAVAGFKYSSNNEAFDVACNTFKDLIKEK